MIGFAAETENLIENAKAKFARKGCDWILANDVSPASGVMGGDRNAVHLLTRNGAEIAVEFLAGDDQGAGRGRTDRARRQSGRPGGGDGLVSAAVKVEIRQLPHAEGLALPAYQSAGAAGLDLLAAVPQTRRWFLRPENTRWCRPGL